MHIKMAILITSILAILFLCLYISKTQDYSSLQKDNHWLKEQHELARTKSIEDSENEEPLNQDTAMTAIRFNGFVPEADGDWIKFMSQGERFLIDTGRFPVLVLMKHYNLDQAEYDMDLMHKAAHQVSDDIIMGKVLFTGDNEDGIAFQLVSIENKYGHFRDSLSRYINIIEETQSRMSHIYNEMEKKKKEIISIPRQIVAGEGGEKKILS